MFTSRSQSRLHSLFSFFRVSRHSANVFSFGVGVVVWRNCWESCGQRSKGFSTNFWCIAHSSNSVKNSGSGSDNLRKISRWGNSESSFSFHQQHLLLLADNSQLSNEDIVGLVAVNGSERLSAETDEKMPQSQKRKKDARYFQTRFQVKKLNLDIAQLDPVSLAKRIELNHLEEFPANNHPAEDAVSAFKITEEVLKPVDISKEREFWFVEEQSKLEDMRKIINSKTVIGVDVEVDSEYSYVPIITLIQISCDTHDFIIDATKLFPFITENLQSIFLDNSIVKLVFSQNDIREFKRDFSLYFAGIIDLQSVHQWVSGEKNQVGLEKFVKIYLDRGVDKTHQEFHFKLRPLPDYILEYAKNDSRLLLDCWEVMKPRHREYLLNQYNYRVMNDIILKPFSFPKSKPIEKEFEKAERQLAKAKRDLFTRKRYFNVFMRVLEWRKSSARIRDIPPDKVLNQEQVVRLCVVQPKSVHMLDSVISTLTDWKLEWKESLVNAIITKNEKENKT